MSGQRRRSPNPGGGDQQPQGRRSGGPGRPYAYGKAPEGVPSYDRSGSGGEELRAEGFSRPRAGARETAQQPRLTRAEMRKQGRNGGGAGGAGGPGGPGGGGGGRRGGPPPKKRFIDYPRWGKTGFRRWVPSWKQVLTVFLVFFGGGVATVGVAYAMTPKPQLKDLVSTQNNIYYWADGKEMTRSGTTNRQIVEIPDISRDAQNAVIAAENESFRTDSGIDPKGMLRAVYNMATGGQTQGGSTITQQYVKNAYLSQEQTLSRKFKELLITLKVNQTEGKDEILKGYLNTSWFGRGTGIEAAAQAYYNEPAKNLDPCQSAMLAGLLKGASLYDPSLGKPNHDRMFGPPGNPSAGRWEWILSRMVVTKAISQDQMNQCIAKGFPDPQPRKPPANMNGQVYYLVDMANNYLKTTDSTITDATLAKGGYQIYTTFHHDLVDDLGKAVDSVEKDNLDANKRPKTDTNVQVGASVVVPGDGAIVAIYGGPGIENGHYTDNANSDGVPVGSTFKPIVLATAMQVGVLTKTTDGKPTRISPDSKYNGDDMAPIFKADGSPVIGDDGKPYHQKNDDNIKHGYQSLRTAMQYSWNSPYVQLGQDVGNKNVADMAVALGLRRESLAPPSSATFPIGTSTPSSVRMASVYSVFAARGQQVDPYSVSKLLKDGHDVAKFSAKHQTKPVLDQAVADNITDVLVNVAKNGTGTKTNALGRPVAGKTGTTDAGTSAWWTGYTPQLAASVGMWREEPGKPGLLSLDGTGGHTSFHGGDMPAEIFTAFMKDALSGQKSQDFPSPEQTGTEVDASGAPASPTASPSASASASATQPSEPAKPSAGPTCLPGIDCPGDKPSPSDQPTKPQPSCVFDIFGTCNTPSGKPTRGGKSSPPPSPTDTTGASNPPAQQPGQ